MLAEEHLLISLARIAEGTDQRLPNSFPSINWERFMRLARFHGLSGIASTVISAGFSKSWIPTKVASQLRDVYYGTIALNLLLLDSLRNVSEKFRNQGVDFLVVKGAILLGKMYKDIGTRPMGDIDILIKPEHLPKAISMVQKLGYSNTKHSAGQYARLPVVLELHTRFTDLTAPVRLNLSYMPTSLEDNAIWARARITRELGFPVSTLCEDHNLALILLHMGYKHQFGRFIWCVDFTRLVSELIDKEDWRGILRVAKETNTYGLMSDALLYVDKFLQINVPDSIYRDLSKYDRPILQRSILSALYNSKLVGWTRHIYSFTRTKGLRGKIAYIVRAFRPSKRFLSLQSRTDKSGVFSYLEHCFKMLKEAIILLMSIAGVNCRVPYWAQKRTNNL